MFQPYAFTEQGVAMLSTVLRSRRAIVPLECGASAPLCRPRLAAAAGSKLPS